MAESNDKVPALPRQNSPEVDDPIIDGLQAIQELARRQAADDAALREAAKPLAEATMQAARSLGPGYWATQSERRDRQANEQTARGVEKSAEIPTVPPSPSVPPGSANPMHAGDRHFYSVLGWSIAWAAIPGSIFVGLVLGRVAGQITWELGIPGMGGSLLVMAALTFYGFKQKTPDLKNPGPMMTFIAILTWIFVGWQTWMFFHRPKQEPLQVTILSAPPALPRGQREFTDTTPEYLMGLYQDKSTYQGDQLFKPFIGKWMHLTETVADVTENQIWSYLEQPNTKPRPIVMEVEDPNQLGTVQLKKKISVQCQITAAKVNLLFLTHCEFESK
jgi:hypothetical protein